MWAALVCFAYGVAAWHAEPAPAAEPVPFEIDGPAGPDGPPGPAGLRGALERDRAARLAEIGGWLAAAPAGPADLHEEDRYPAAGQGLRLSTVTAPHLAGQIVTDGDRTVYASLFAR